MIWVNSAAILISAYVMAYALMRVAAYVVPRLMTAPPSPLPLGMFAAISLIGFCMVTGTPGAAIVAMLAMCIAGVRYEFFAASPRVLYGASLIASALIASLALTFSGWQVDGISPYALAGGIGVALCIALGGIAQLEALHLSLLLVLAGISVALPLALDTPFHTALDGAIVLACIGAYHLARRHLRHATTLGSAFSMPALVIMLHGLVAAAISVMKGL